MNKLTSIKPQNSNNAPSPETPGVRNPVTEAAQNEQGPYRGEQKMGQAADRTDRSPRKFKNIGFAFSQKHVS